MNKHRQKLNLFRQQIERLKEAKEHADIKYDQAEIGSEQEDYWYNQSYKFKDMLYKVRKDYYKLKHSKLGFFESARLKLGSYFPRIVKKVVKLPYRFTEGIVKDTWNNPRKGAYKMLKGATQLAISELSNFAGIFFPESK